jgi:iron complex transport system substrate-binding protein
MRTRFFKLLALAVLVATAAACGGEDSAPAATGGALPTTPTSAPSGPSRIVSLSPTATETLFAIGAGKQVIAVDDQSNHPAEAPRTDLSGFTPNVEAIAAKKPDLVVFSADMGGLKKKLDDLGVKSILQEPASTLEQAYAQITALGTATGRTKEAAQLVDKMKADIDAAIKKVTKPAVAPKVYHELDNTLYSASSKSFIGELYAKLGLANIADAADKSGTGYPQLSNEYVIAQNPDLIVLADTKCCGQNAKTVAARPGWSQLKAVTSGSVVEVDDDIASRWGPRTPQLVAQLAAALAKVPPR